MPYTFLQCDTTHDSHWIITLNRPDKRNALCDALVGELLDTIAQANHAAIPCLVFQGEGKNFSAGFDFSDLESVSAAGLLWRLVRVQQLLTAIEHYPGLTIGIAHGRNFGAGCDLFAACAQRIATQTATFRMPGVLFGLILGTRRLGDLIGNSAAKQLQMTVQTLPATQAQALNFVSEIIADDRAVTHTLIKERWLGQTAALAPSTRQDLQQALTSPTSHEDMGRLVTSIMRTDLKTRIQQFLQQARQ